MIRTAGGERCFVSESRKRARGRSNANDFPYSDRENGYICIETISLFVQRRGNPLINGGYEPNFSGAPRRRARKRKSFHTVNEQPCPVRFFVEELFRTPLVGGVAR